MLRSEIPGNKKHLTDEISSKIVEYNLSRGSEPLIRKRNNLDPKLENKYNNKTGKKLINNDNEMSTRSSQLSDYNFIHLRDQPNVSDGNINYFHLNKNARKNQLIDKDRKIDKVEPSNILSTLHRKIEDPYYNPTLGITNIESKNKLSKNNLIEGNREPYMPQQFSNISQNKIIYKVMS